MVPIRILSAFICISLLTAACMGNHFKQTTGTWQEQESKHSSKTLYVSVKEVPITASPYAFSKIVTILPYGSPIKVESKLVVVPQGLEKRQKIPRWGVVEYNGKKGYIPMNSVVSEWLINNQDPEFTLDDLDYHRSVRGFSEEEKADLVAMRGAVGSAEFSGPDYDSLSYVLAASFSEDLVSELAQSGHIATDKPGIEMDVVKVKDTRTAASQTARRTLSSVMQQGGSIAGDLNLGHRAERATMLAQSASSLVYNETGPLQEYIIGRAVAARLIGEFSPLDVNSEPYRYLQAIGEIMSRGSSSPYPYDGYKFILIEGEDPNAFAAPGGFIFVNKGMLSFLESEDELAAILGHEIAHVELGHGMQAVNQERLLSFFGVIAELGMHDLTSSADLQQLTLLQQKAEELLKQIVDDMLNAIRQGYSREIETEADLRSIEISAALGYDTSALYNILNRFKDVRGDYGGASYPRERSNDAKIHQLVVDPDHNISTLMMRTARYKDVMHKF